MAKRKYERVVTPAGIAKFPALNTPDYKFDEMGKYKVDLIVDPKDVKEFEAKILEIREAFIEADEKATVNLEKKGWTKELPISLEEDEDGNETGKMLIRASQAAKSQSGEYTFSVALFDARGQTMTEEIWGGSKLKLSVELVPYAMPSAKKYGVSLRLRAVQVLELVTAGGMTAEAAGFDVEDGFETAPPDADTPTAPEGAESDGSEF